MKKYLVSVLIIIQLVVILVLLMQLECRSSLKPSLIQADAAIFNGFLRRLYHQQSLPRQQPLNWPTDALDYSWLENQPFLTIAHGLGPYLLSGRNTLRTLDKGRARGFKVFEVDISLTADNVLICDHGGKEEDINTSTYSDYLALCRSKRQVPCRFDDLVNYARKNSDVHFVLDVKNRYNDVYEMIRKVVQDQNLGKSFIPQVYDFDQLQLIRKDSLFAGEIFTSYRSALTNSQIFNYAKIHGIKVIALTLGRFEELKGEFPGDVFLLTHPVNDPFLAADLKTSGIRGIYTSYINPQSVPELFTDN